MSLMGCFGSRSAAMKVENERAVAGSRQTWYRAMRLWVLPPPKLVSTRITGAFLDFTPVSRPSASASKLRRPPAGRVARQARWVAGGVGVLEEGGRLAVDGIGVPAQPAGQAGRRGPLA